jgi:hypothetical protein
MLFARPWTSLCLLAGSWTGAWARQGGLSEDPDIKAISVGCCHLSTMGIVANESIATDTQHRARKSHILGKDTYNVREILTPHAAIPRLGHAKPLVGFWRRHHHSN